MLRKNIYFLAYIFIIVIQSGKCRSNSLEPPPEIICSLLCKDDLVNDLDELLSDISNQGMDFEKLVYQWKNLFDEASLEKQKYICWHYIDFDHCLRHCASDPKIFLPVQLEPLEVHCVPYMTDYADSVECIGQYHQAIESNCAAYANSIQLALERWMQNENFCKLISQHLDCLTINAEFYCGSQLVDPTFFSKRFHTIISRGNELTAIKKLFKQCYNFSTPGTMNEKDDKDNGIFATTSPSTPQWTPDTTESMVPNVTATEKLSTKNMPKVFENQESTLTFQDYFAKSVVLFSPFDNLTGFDHQESVLEIEQPKHQPLFPPAYSSSPTQLQHFFICQVFLLVSFLML